MSLSLEASEACAVMTALRSWAMEAAVPTLTTTTSRVARGTARAAGAGAAAGGGAAASDLGGINSGPLLSAMVSTY